MISASALRGYVLEEMLAGLLKGSGFDLLVSAAQDPAALCAAGNGLRIRGRGADHQVDVLGQLRIRIPFALPVRLFVEAKYRGTPSGLGDVRNALGVLSDVNEHYSTAVAQASTGAYERYDYRYALFSASGFTTDAQLFAVAQQISLIDLRGPAFSWLLDAAARAADALLALADASGVSSFPMNQMREAMRRALGTWPLSDPPPPDDFAAAASRARMADGTASETDRLPAGALADVLAQVADLDGTLFLAFTASPFALVVQPDDPAEAAELLGSLRAAEPAELAFAGPNAATGEWALVTTGTARPVTFRFGLPPELERWVLAADRPGGGSEAESPRTVSIMVGQRETRVLFAPLPWRAEPVVDSDAVAAPGQLRTLRLRPDLAFRADAPSPADDQWPAQAVRELLRRLRREQWPHADIIEAAAANGGTISRAQVYEIAGYPETRMLRGFTRPPRRVTRELIREGRLPAGAQWPLLTRYDSGVQATHFVVPEEFTRLLP